MMHRAAAILVIGCVQVALAAGAAASHDPSGSPAFDFVTSRQAETVVAGPGIIFTGIDVTAQSDPLGGSPSGQVSFTVRLRDPFPVTQDIFVRGPVTCLAVTDNRAVVGFTDEVGGLGQIITEVVDNGTPDRPGTGPDTFFAEQTSRAPGDCSPVSLTLGGFVNADGVLFGFVVHDAVCDKLKDKQHKPDVCKTK